MAEIVPTILTANFSDLTQRLDLLEGICERVQIDITDGKFVSNRTIPLESLVGQETKLKVDLHLMVKDPEEWVNRALEVLPDRIIGQVEMMNDPKHFINSVVEGGVAVGIGLDLETAVESVEEEIYRMCDLVLIMSVKAGEGGQSFDPRSVVKIEQVKKILGDLGKIAVDGGLNEENILQCKGAGANIFYVGKTFWEAEDLKIRYNELINFLD